MVIVKLQGGLGNQMFQYAVARGIAGHNQLIYLDLETLRKHDQDTPHFTARSYELGIFSGLSAYAVRPSMVSFLTSNRLLHRIACVFFKFRYIRQHENELIHAPVNKMGTVIYLDGYFQSENYFKIIKAELLKEFRFPALHAGNRLLEKKIRSSKNAVSLHVRRGDYLKSDVILNVHGVLPATYYAEALDKLRERYGSLEVFVFSDDIPWCKANIVFNGGRTTFVSGNTGAESWMDLALMSACRHHIIANSSFSWWGAWLSREGGDVLAPDRWFNPGNVNFDIRDFVPHDWQLLHVK
jgi:hypothetical protein